MEQVDITWSRALKIWWSYSWRAFVLVLLVMVPVEIVMFCYVFRQLPGSAAHPADGGRLMAGIALAWPIVMAVLVALQAQAMRWMLNKARWSDFRVVVLPPD
jgi:hypothetical protein